MSNQVYSNSQSKYNTPAGDLGYFQQTASQTVGTSYGPLLNLAPSLPYGSMTYSAGTFSCQESGVYSINAVMVCARNALEPAARSIYIEPLVGVNYPRLGESSVYMAADSSPLGEDILPCTVVIRLDPGQTFRVMVTSTYAVPTISLAEVTDAVTAVYVQKLY